MSAKAETGSAPFARRPTMDDIARLAEVSKPTVSRALSGSPLVSPATREKVMRIARDHGYAVNRSASNLRRDKTGTVAVVLDFGSHREGAIGDPFVFELLAGVSEALASRNLDVLLLPPGLDAPDAFLDLYRAKNVDGFIMLGQGAREPSLRALARKGVPLVVWGAVAAGTPYCAVGSDNLKGGALVGERFLRKGRRRWLFVGPLQHAEIRLRYDGMRSAAEAHPEIDVEVLEISSMAFSSTYRSIRDLAEAGKRPDAVFAFSDTAAMAVISAFRESHWLTPRDYSLVGYNDIPPAAHYDPPITTVRQETNLAGSILVERLMQAVEGSTPKSLFLPTHLVERGT